MGSIDESSSSSSSFLTASSSSSSSAAAIGAKILVGISLDALASSELLSWAVGVAAHPNDTIIAMHVLGQCCSFTIPLHPIRFVVLTFGFHSWQGGEQAQL